MPTTGTAKRKRMQQGSSIQPESESKAPKKGAFERDKEQWHRQLIADRTLLQSDLRVGIAISWHMNRQQGGLAWPGIRKLAKLTGLSKPTVIGAINRLAPAGHVSIYR